MTFGTRTGHSLDHASAEGGREVVKRVPVRSVRAEKLSDFRAGVVIMEGHVVCFFYDGDGEALEYMITTRKSAKKDSPRRMRADEIIDEMSGGSSLFSLIISN